MRKLRRFRIAGSSGVIRLGTDLCGGRIIFHLSVQEGQSPAVQRQILLNSGQSLAVERQILLDSGQSLSARRQILLVSGQNPAVQRQILFDSRQSLSVQRQILFDSGQSLADSELRLARKSGAPPASPAGMETRAARETPRLVFSRWRKRGFSAHPTRSRDGVKNRPQGRRSPSAASATPSAFPSG